MKNKKTSVLIFIFYFALSYSKDDANQIFRPKQFIEKTKEINVLPQLQETETYLENKDTNLLLQLQDAVTQLEHLFVNPKTATNINQKIGLDYDLQKNNLDLYKLISMQSKTEEKTTDSAAPDPLAGLMALLKGPFKVAYSLMSPLFLPAPFQNKPGTLSGPCGQQVQLMHDQATGNATPDVWWGQMVDAWAKPYSGVLVREALLAFGQMQECLTIRHPTELDFSGKYCFVSVGKGNYPLMRYGTCIPSGCSNWEYQDTLQNRWSMVVNKTVVVECFTQQFANHWGTWEIACSAAIGILLAVVVLATALEILKKKNVPKWLHAFSAATNTGKILAVRGSNPREITCFHALRVFSISWVLLGHQLTLIFTSISNAIDLDDITKNYGSQIIYSGYRAVDTFFLMGGILLAKSLLNMDFCVKKVISRDITISRDEDFEKNEKEHFISEERLIWNEVKYQGLVKIFFNFLTKYAFFIFHRFVRIWPSLLLTTLFFAGPALLFVQGPMQISLQSYFPSYVENCRQNWWYDLTFLTNFLATGWIKIPGHTTTSCLGQAWYVAMDFQLFLVMPFLLLPIKLMKYKQTYITLLILASCIIPAVLTDVKNLLPGNVFYGFLDPVRTEEYGKYIYYVPWSRSTPYFVGALIGYWLTLYDSSKKTGQELYADFLTKFPSLAKLYPRVWGWAIVTAIALAVVFGLVESNYMSDTTHVVGHAASVVNNGLNVLAWCTVVGWVIVMCAMGLAGPLNFFLSHPMWQPLSRLSFGVYLVSFPLQILLLHSFQQLIYLTYNMLLLTWCGLLAISFAGAYVLSILIEAPVINLLKLIKK